MILRSSSTTVISKTNVLIKIDSYHYNGLRKMPLITVLQPYQQMLLKASR